MTFIFGWKKRFIAEEKRYHETAHKLSHANAEKERVETENHYLAASVKSQADESQKWMTRAGNAEGELLIARDDARRVQRALVDEKVVSAKLNVDFDRVRESLRRASEALTEEHVQRVNAAEQVYSLEKQVNSLTHELLMSKAEAVQLAKRIKRHRAKGEEKERELHRELGEIWARYHDLVIKIGAPAPGTPPATVEGPAMGAEERARHAISIESKRRLAEAIRLMAKEKGRTVSEEDVLNEAEQMFDFSENIVPEPN